MIFTPSSRSLARAAVALALTTGAAVPAAAQLIEDVPTVVVPPAPPITTARSVFAHDRVTPVADRVLPEFSAQGLTVGAFDVFPGLAIGGLFSSNVFADDARKKSDFAAVVRPELTIRTSGGPYGFAAYGRGDFRRYAHLSSENTEEGLGGVEGSVAVSPLSSLTAGASYGSLIEPRYAADSPADAAKPLEYKALNGYGGATIEGASTRIILRGDVVRLRFRDTPGIGGGELYTRDRDRTRYQGLVRLERSISPAFSIYGAASANKIDYRFTGNIPRNSKGYGLYLGSSFEITTVMRGDVRVGYIYQNFDLTKVRPIRGLGALGTVIYFPNRLWTFTAHAESTVQDSGVPGSGGFLHRGGSLRADNELRRYIIASFEGGYFKDNYRGLDRRDKLPFADVSATYLSHGHWNARLGYRYIARSCTCSSGVTNFNDHRVSATLTFQY